jgi:hypothetical protein
MSEDTQNTTPVAWKKLAFIYSGQVVNTMLFSDELANVLLDNPVIVDVTNNANMILTGWTYDESSNEFSAPTQG